MNAEIRGFFEKIEFSFAEKSSDFVVLKNFDLRDDRLNKTLKDKIYLYKTENTAETNTSFYIIDKNISKEEHKIIQKYIWNSPDADLYFYRKANGFELIFVKNYDEGILLDYFEGKDSPKIAHISKTKIDNGLLWFYYLERIEKKIQLDKILKTRLENLRKSLEKKLQSLEREQRNEFVQALIDRTLFIKFLEDKHILNSAFYNKFFDGKDYATLLEDKNSAKLNELFTHIHKIFHQHLFKDPEIPTEVLTDEILEELYQVVCKFPTEKNGQIGLFPFRFDLIPTEFISHIYEIFLEKSQKENGIFYTPRNLAELIVERTITKKGKVLDPSCGSGIFLVLAFRKLQELEKINSKVSTTTAVQRLIHTRCDILKKYIFGIELKETAQRLAMFSLYLEIIRDIPADLLKKIIEDLIKNLNSVNEIKESDWIFNIQNFKENIKETNTLNVNKTELVNFIEFDFIVGNPPFNKDLGIEGQAYLENETSTIEIIEDNKKIDKKVSDIVSKRQLSQLFFCKIKDFANAKTRFGFVQNSSNFYDEKSEKFRSFFFGQYKIEEIFELSKIKNILFESTPEPVFATIFTNEQPTSEYQFAYYSPELSNFAKVFEVIVIDKDKGIMFRQQEVAEGTKDLREYLLGNEYSNNLLEKISNKSQNSLNYFLLIDSDYNAFRGMQIVGFEAIMKYKKITKQQYDLLSNDVRKNYQKEFRNSYTSINKQGIYQIPCLHVRNIKPFAINGNPEYYLPDFENKGTPLDFFDNFERPKNLSIYNGKKILFNRTGTETYAVFTSEKKYFLFDIYVIKLQENLAEFKDLEITAVYQTFTAILNSLLSNYYLQHLSLKRKGANFPKNNTQGIKDIPIPNLALYPNLVAKISQKVSEISAIDFEELEKVKQKAALELKEQAKKGKKTKQGTLSNDIFIGEVAEKPTTILHTYNKLKEDIDELVFELYQLNLIEKNRIKEFFLYQNEKNILKEEKDLNDYCNILRFSVQLYLGREVIIKPNYNKNKPFGFVAVALFHGTEAQINNPAIENFLNSEIIDILDTKNNKNFMLVQEKFYGKNCIYIIKDDKRKNWTKTTAYEDGQEILRMLGYGN